MSYLLITVISLIISLIISLFMVENDASTQTFMSCWIVNWVVIATMLLLIKAQVM